MPVIEGNGITISYELDGPSSGELLVLVNGLADDLTTWSAQTPDFTAAGYRVLRYDNRGVGASSRPPGPYTAGMLADDLFALLTALAIEKFHLLGVSMGGMIAQAYALRYANGSPRAGKREMLTLSLCCTYAQPTLFCARMFDLWADMAVQMSVRDVMRDVTLWAFTVPFFRTRTEDLEAVDGAMDGLEMGLEEYLGQLNVIQKFDVASQLESLKAAEQVVGNLESGRVMVLAGKVDILIPVVLSRELAERIEGSRFLTCKGGHGCMWEFAHDFNKTVLGFLDEYKSKHG